MLDDDNAALSSLRLIRLIRILKLFKPNTFMGRFVSFMIVSVRDLFFYTILLSIFLFIFALAGRELFAYKIFLYNKMDSFGYVDNNDFVSPRENFDSFSNSIITVFILFIGDV
jgi:hypothetical protein